MDQEEDFHGKAAESLELAKSAKSVERKSRLLALAQAWLQLADKVRRSREHGNADRFSMG